MYMHVYVTPVLGNRNYSYCMAIAIATKVFIGELPATRGVWVRAMMRGGHGPIRQLQDLNWGAFDCASHAPQLTYMWIIHMYMYCS